MNIAVFGLGYVGCVTAACLSRNGHYVIGVDNNAEKVKVIQKGKSPIIEPGLTELLLMGVASKNIEATCDATYAIEKAEIAIICVGTPSDRNGNLELKYLKNVCASIGQSLCTKREYMVIVVRSTILPGIAQDCLIPLIETESHKKAGDGFGFCVNPEFLREGSAINDFDTPPFTVIGQYDDKSGKLVSNLYENINAPLFRVSLGTAEMIKYTSNAFHALKVVFANEIGNLCQAYEIDSNEVMDIFIKDTKLNISPKYLKPGFAFGGSCLGKDIRALLYSARKADLKLPLLESVLPSNQLQVEKALQMVINENKRSVGLIGLSFKINTDDLRESPAVELAERLIGKGFKVNIYDREVTLSHIFGSNRAYIDLVIPHIGDHLKPTLEETINTSDTIIITKNLSNEEYETISKLLRPNHSLFNIAMSCGKNA